MSSDVSILRIENINRNQYSSELIIKKPTIGAFDHAANTKFEDRKESTVWIRRKRLPSGTHVSEPSLGASV